VEYVFDLGSGVGWGKPTILSFWSLTIVFQLNIRWSDCNRVLCMYDNTVIFCCILCC